MNHITMLAKMLKNKVVRTVGGQKPTDGDINMDAYATNDYVQPIRDKVNGFEVGGRNYLLDSATAFTSVGNTKQNQILSSPTNDTNKRFSFGNILNIPAKVDDPVAISADILVTGTAPAGTFSFMFSNTPWGGGVNKQFNISDFTIGTVKRVPFVTTADTSWYNTTNAATGIQIRMDNVPTTITLSASNWKFEKGNLPTDYTQAPEDIQAQFTALNKKIYALEAKISGGVTS